MPIVVCCIGIVSILGICWLWSDNRRLIMWKTVVWGMVLQLALAALTFAFPPGVEVLRGVGNAFTWLLGFSEDGARFLFGNIASSEHTDLFGFQFALTLLPMLIFLGSVTAILFHYGILQRLVRLMAWVMQRTMGTTATESLSTAANVFLGQVEAPLLVRHYIPNATSSEVFALMVGGFATIAGSVMGVYAAMGIPADVMIIASLLAAPATLVLSKMVMPLPPGTLEAAPHAESLDGQESDRSNLIDAIARGALDGFRIAVNVIVVLIAFKSLVALADASLAWSSTVFASWGWQGAPASLDTILGWLFTPFGWMLGVPANEVQQVSQLLGVKVSQTEFLAYEKLSVLINSGALSHRTVVVTTVALCGFANVMSIGIQIGGFSIMAPLRRAEVAQMGLRAMCVGGLVNLLTACVVGLFIPA
jgi:CNT family concentrative nucleoside transporter